MDTIYLIGYVSYDDHNYRSVSVDEDFGFYTSEEAVKAEIDRLHGYRKAYDTYVAQTQEAHNQELQAYAQRKIGRQRALDAGLGDLVPEPRKPAEPRVKTFEQYTYDRGFLYDYVAVSAAT